jgi:ubiquinone/menaquinone biosynthesis C-methylase UbiE
VGFAKWYDDHIVPRFIKCACSAESIMDLRKQVVPLASGAVFEIGCGGGINQQLYDPARISSYAGLDPSAKGLDYARAEAARKGWQVDIRQGEGEALPFADASFDTAVCTFTMCSVADQTQTLKELRRVLKPGGRLLYAEHGRAPDPAVAKWQDRIDPLWSKLAGGCHITRPVTSAVTAAGFSAEPIGQHYTEKMPRWAAWMEWGVAVKAN